jgi:hypothetical protein
MTQKEFPDIVKLIEEEYDCFNLDNKVPKYLNRLEYLINTVYSSDDILAMITKIIPYMEENFITFPLWEEGIYFPTVCIWQLLSEAQLTKLDELIEKEIRPKGYECFYERGKIMSTVITITPKYDINYEDTGSYFNLANPNWSIAEMLQCCLTIITKI